MRKGTKISLAIVISSLLLGFVGYGMVEALLPIRQQTTQQLRVFDEARFNKCYEWAEGFVLARKDVTVSRHITTYYIYNADTIAVTVAILAATRYNAEMGSEK